MAKETEIRKKALEILKKEGWVCWWPAKVKFRESDIFGAFDLIISRKNKIKFIQLTTTSNLSTRRKKVEKFLKINKLKIPSEIWGYSQKSKGFKIIKI
jgi:hypothetical protein